MDEPLNGGFICRKHDIGYIKQCPTCAFLKREEKNCEGVKSMNPKVVIYYRTREEFCRCCHRKIQNAKTSEIREFEFDKQDLINYGDWGKFAEFEDDLEEIIREHVYETINFFATNSSNRLLIEEGEFDKMKRFILGEVIS